MQIDASAIVKSDEATLGSRHAAAPPPPPPPPPPALDEVLDAIELVVAPPAPPAPEALADALVDVVAVLSFVSSPQETSATAAHGHKTHRTMLPPRRPTRLRDMSKRRLRRFP